MTKILSVKNISKKYHQQSALANVNLSIKKGEIYGLIGRNGAGKTTLLRIITSLSSPTEGSVKLFGSENKRQYIENLDRTGSVIESPVAFDNLSAEENLRYYCKLRGILENGDIQKILKMVDLTETGKKKFKHFSLLRNIKNPHDKIMRDVCFRQF